MRKISEEAAEAFFAARNFKKSNTEVTVQSSGLVMLKLFGYIIATSYPENVSNPRLIRFSMCGWGSQTTRERLWAIGVSVYQKNRQQRWLQPDGQDTPIHVSESYFIEYSLARQIANLHAGRAMQVPVWPNNNLRKE